MLRISKQQSANIVHSQTHFQTPKLSLYLVLQLELRISYAAHDLRCPLDVLLSRHAIAVFEKQTCYTYELFRLLLLACPAACSKQQKK